MYIQIYVIRSLLVVWAGSEHVSSAVDGPSTVQAEHGAEEEGYEQSVPGIFTPEDDRNGCRAEQGEDGV